MFRLTRTQNRGFSLRCITYNMHRMTNLIKLMMFSTKPIEYELRQNEVMTTQICRGRHLFSRTKD